MPCPSQGRRLRRHPSPRRARRRARLTGDPLSRGRFAPRRLAVRAGPHADDIFAEVDGTLVQYRPENGTTLRRIMALAGDGKVKLSLAAPPFGQAVTGDPVLFRAYAPDGDVHLAALVYAEVNKLLYLWYDHGNDSWSLLPP